MKSAAMGCGFLLTGLLWLASSSLASAQSSSPISEERHVDVASPERYALEIRVGPYWPNVGNSSFRDTFPDDFGPLVAGEFDVLPIRIPYIGLLGMGAGFGWVEYDARAFQAGSTNRSGEKTSLTLFPLDVVAVLRVDILAREVGIPLVLTGKIGADVVFWNAQTGTRTDGTGASVGLRWAGQLAMEMDWFDPRAARALDEEWGINHAFLFGEIFGSTASTSLPVGGIAYTFGLGFIF